MIQKSLLDVCKFILGQLLESWEQNIDLTLVFLVGKCQKVVCEVLSFDLGVSFDELEDFSLIRLSELVIILILVPVLRILHLKQVVDLSERLLFFLLREGAFLQLIEDPISIFWLG